MVNITEKIKEYVIIGQATYPNLIERQDRGGDEEDAE